jgi:hypothetical protein
MRIEGQGIKVWPSMMPTNFGAIVSKRPFMHPGVDWKAAPKTAQW